MAQQLDLVEFIASMPADRAGPCMKPAQALPVPDEVLALLPRRPAAWRRVVAPIGASAIIVSVSTLWTRQVVEWVRQPDQSLLLGHDGRIDAIPGQWPAVTRTVAMEAEAALDLPWPLEPIEITDTCLEFRFSPDRRAETLTARGLLLDLMKKMEGAAA
ncbi:hypothetical protein ACMAUO_12630 [Gluconacetobacter sp. Hr-1-5]|uniref:hypothetical protein n=1 Tax=Gluconacetobacter sp. Hr-1-5 TaxID=3395370 RepID=UPI003B5268A6